MGPIEKAKELFDRIDKLEKALKDIIEYGECNYSKETATDALKTNNGT